MPKKYVEVGAVHRTDGQILPVLLWWEDGRSYQIDPGLGYQTGRQPQGRRRGAPLHLPDMRQRAISMA